MKLHLPKTLFVAVLAAVCCVPAWADSVAPSDAATTADGDLLWSFVDGTITNNLSSGVTGSISADGTIKNGSLLQLKDINSTSTSGFTVSFDLLGADLGNWKDVVSLGSTNGSYEIQLQKSDAGNLMLYPTEKDGGNWFGGGSSPKTDAGYSMGELSSLIGKTLTLTFAYNEASQTSAFSAYVNGSLACTINFAYAEGATPSTGLSDITFGRRLDGIDRNCNSVQVNNVGIWDSAMTAAEVAAIILKELTYSTTLTGTIAASEATWTVDGQSAAYANISKRDSIVLNGSGTLKITDDLTVMAVTIASGDATLQVDDTLTVRDTNLSFLTKTTGAGTIVLSDGGSIAPDATSDFAGVLDVAAGTTLQLSPGDQKDKSPLDIEDATVRLNARSTLWIQGHGVKIGAVDVVDTSTMRLFDGNENVVVNGEVGITMGELRIAQGKTLTVTDDWEANLLIESLNAKGKLDLDHDSAKVFITIGSIAESGAIDNAGKTTLGIDGKSVLNLGGAVTNTGTLTIKGNLAGTSTISGGTINLASTASVSGDITFGSNINIAETLVNTGSVTLGGDVYIDSMAALDGDVVYSANGGKDGFITSALCYVVKGDGDTAASSLSGESTLYEGSIAIGSIIQSTDGKSLVLSVSAENANNDIYYVNTQDMTATAEDAARATGYVVADGLGITANHTGESKVINSSNISIGSNATLNLSGNIGIEGTGDLNNGGTLNFGGNALKSTAAEWNWKGNINISSDVTVSGGAISIAQGCTVTLLDGASLLRNENGSYRVKGTLAVADNAEAILSTTDDIHFNYPADAGGEAVLRLGAGSTLNLTAKSFQQWGERGYIELGADSKLNVNCADFQIRDLRMNASSSMVFNSGSNLNMNVASIAVDGNITLNEGANLNMKSQGNQTIAGNVILNGGKIISENGNGDNRVKTIEHLSGSGEIEGSNWNVIWNIGELAGDGDITWRNNGTHWAPSVLNINGGTFTGKLTADRAAGYNKDNRGDYQSVLQINEGGAKTLAGAVVKLQGNGADAYMQMALNTAEVSIGGLEGTQHSHIYAGSAIIEGGEQNQFCQNKANSTGTSVLKLSSDEKQEHTYAGSVGAGISLEKSGAGKQTFSGDMSAFNGSLMAAAGELAFTATEALSVNNLSVANVGKLTVANGDAAGNLSASGAVTLAGGATINAAVVDLSDASSVSFDVTSGGAIALNGALTMSSTEAFVAALGDSMAGLTAGDILTVFTGVSSFTVGGVTYDASNALTNVDLRDWGADAAVGQYTLTYDTFANVGSIVITVGEVIPEPASATLSLAALMMLCARRRRRS